METIEKINDIGRDNSYIEEMIKVLDLSIADRKRAYKLELAFENDLGFYSKNIANIAAELDRFKAEKAMRQMQLMENNKILLTMLTLEVTRNKYRLN